MLDFIKWVDDVLSRKPSYDTIAYNFNLYEQDAEHYFDVQLVGSATYSRDNDDWACKNTFSSGENVFVVEAEDWEDCLMLCEKLVREYLSKGTHAEILLNAQAVTIGFIDGDLICVHNMAM